MFSFFKKIFSRRKIEEKKEEIKPTDEQLEMKKWLTILQNVSNYDGTSKGQIKIG